MLLSVFNFVQAAVARRRPESSRCRQRPQSHRREPQHRPQRGQAGGSKPETQIVPVKTKNIYCAAACKLLIPGCPLLLKLKWGISCGLLPCAGSGATSRGRGSAPARPSDLGDKVTETEAHGGAETSPRAVCPHPSRSRCPKTKTTKNKEPPEAFSCFLG